MNWREAYTWSWEGNGEWTIWGPGGVAWTAADIEEIATRLNRQHAELQQQVADVDRLEEANRELARLAYEQSIA